MLLDFKKCQVIFLKYLVSSKNYIKVQLKSAKEIWYLLRRFIFTINWVRNSRSVKCLNKNC